MSIPNVQPLQVNPDEVDHAEDVDVIGQQSQINHPVDVRVIRQQTGPTIHMPELYVPVSQTESVQAEDNSQILDKLEQDPYDCTKFKSSDEKICWIPNVPEERRPKERDKYPCYEDVKAMYYFYAVEAGFDVRKSSRKLLDGLITLQYFVCNRQGNPNTSDINTLDSNLSKIERRTDMYRRGCDAHIKCRIIPGSKVFELYHVEEKHNHPLYSKANNHLSKTARKLDSIQKAFILRMSTQNIGPTIAHRLYSALRGSYNRKGGTKDDFKNYMRDLNCHIDGSDAQLVVNKMNDRKSHVTNFSFDYKVDGKQPCIVLSDQDAAMKKAIAQVFPESKHRLCMWHITSKLQAKVCDELYDNLEFKRRFNALAWNSKINASEFDEGWNTFIDDYKLYENKWFKDMFRIRDQWIPPFFKEIPMSGLMRTTSRSESQNSSFQLTTDNDTNLVNFMIAFEGAMEKQRHNQSVLDFKDNVKSRKIRSILDIELNAANHYTRQIFLEVQHEIRHSIISCFQTSKVVDDSIDFCVISEVKSIPSLSTDINTKHDESDSSIQWDLNLSEKEFQVRVNCTEQTFTCTCMHFEHVGILCRHIFCVMRFYKLTDIPSKYVLRRWKKDLIPIEILRRTFRNGDMDSDVDMMAFDIFSSVDTCINSLRGDRDKMAEYVRRVKELQSIFVTGSNLVESSSKNIEFEEYIGVLLPSVIEIENPTGIRNKGCGMRKRLRSGKEIAIEKASKEPRMCALCHKPSYHDKRNCPLKKKDETARSFSKNCDST